MGPAEYEVVTVRVGTRNTHRSDVFLNYELYGQEDGDASVDYFFWIIRNSDRVVIVDTGFGQSAGASRGREMLLHPQEALTLLGIDAESVGDVIVTHAHYDHIGNLGLFPNARIHMAESEFDFWTSPVADNVQFSYYSEDSELDQLRAAQTEGRLNLFSGETSLSEGIRLVEVGGHTQGQTIVYVSTLEGVVLLASDSVHFYEELELNMPFTAVSDLPKMYEVFEDLRANSGKTYQVLIPGHDREVLERHPPCHNLPPGEAVVIGGQPRKDSL